MMREIKAPLGPTGALYEDWGRDALGNVIRKIRLYRTGVARNSNYISPDEVQRVWLLNRLNERWRTHLEPVITYALALPSAPKPRGRRPKAKQQSDVPARIEAARGAPVSWATYVPADDVAAYLRANVAAAPITMRDFLLYVADMLVGELRHAGRTGLPRNSLLRDLAVSVEYPPLAAEYRRLKARNSREFDRLCRAHNVKTYQAGDLALQVLCDRYYHDRNLGGRGLRIRLSRKGLLKS